MKLLRRLHHRHGGARCVAGHVHAAADGRAAALPEGLLLDPAPDAVPGRRLLPAGPTHAAVAPARAAHLPLPAPGQRALRLAPAPGLTFQSPYVDSPEILSLIYMYFILRNLLMLFMFIPRGGAFFDHVTSFIYGRLILLMNYTKFYDTCLFNWC